jgi:hypothetical protein
MTTNLPAVATVEAEALEYARGRLIEFRDKSDSWLGQRVGPGHSFLVPEAGHAMVRRLFKELARSYPNDMLRAIATARAGNDDAQDAMLELANEYLHRGQTLPVPLANFQMELNAGLLQRLPARKKSSNYLRNMAFAIIIAELYDKFGLNPTRNRQSRSPSRRRSGCAILDEALKLVEMPRGFFKPGEKALEEIWRQWRLVIDPRLAPAPATAS